MLNYGTVKTLDVDCPICLKSPDQNSKDIVTVRDYLNISSKQQFVYHRCICGVYYLRNQPIKDQISMIYSNNYESYKINSGFVSKLKMIRMRSILKPLLVAGRQTKILDYGCGSGEFMFSIANLVDVPIVGYDFKEPSMPTKSNVIFVESDKEIQVHGKFDLIFSFQVIEHLSDPFQFLKDLNLLLSSNGKVVLETPSSSGILFSKLFRINWGGWHAPRHFVIFNKKSLIDLCIKSGFSVEKFQYIPSPFQWLESIRPHLTSSSKLNKLLSLNNFILVAIFYCIDLFIILLRIRTSNMKLVLSKRI